jgi:hypothetical protein
MPRMSIYVPDEMKAAMDLIGEGRVNWSNAAQVAFAREIDRIKWPQEPTMEDVINRLRASKATFEEKQTAEGQKAGRDWAMKNADYGALRTIASLELRHQPYWQEFDAALGVDPRGGMEESFWFDGERLDPPSDEHVEAFVAGAQEVWNEVADKI